MYNSRGPDCSLPDSHIHKKSSSCRLQHYLFLTAQAIHSCAMDSPSAQASLKSLWGKEWQHLSAGEVTFGNWCIFGASKWHLAGGCKVSQLHMTSHGPQSQWSGDCSHGPVAPEERAVLRVGKVGTDKQLYWLKVCAGNVLLISSWCAVMVCLSAPNPQ